MSFKKTYKNLVKSLPISRKVHEIIPYISSIMPKSGNKNKFNY